MTAMTTSLIVNILDIQAISLLYIVVLVLNEWKRFQIIEGENNKLFSFTLNGCAYLHVCVHLMIVVLTPTERYVIRGCIKHL